MNCIVENDVLIAEKIDGIPKVLAAIGGDKPKKPSPSFASSFGLHLGGMPWWFPVRLI